MAKGNIVRWITVKGRRIPIYEDGSMGGFMEGKKTDSDTDHDKEVLRIRDELDSGKSTTTSNKDIADMYKNSPKKAFDVKDNGDGTYEISKKGSKSLEDHSDIQKIAEEHVKKIWNGGAANRELYDAAEKWAEEHNFDKTKAKDAAFAAMNKKQMAEIKRRESDKSIKVGDKEVAVNKTAGEPGIHETRMQRTKMAIANGQNNLKGMSIGDLKELAIDAGVASSKLKGMSADELRKMILSIYKKK